MKAMRHLPFLGALFLALCTISMAEEPRHVGDFQIDQTMKIQGTEVTKVPMKPLRITVTTDGEMLYISTEGEKARASYKIYRSDGIGRQTVRGGALEIVPGVQAYAEHGGVLRHIRMTRDELTITTFPGVSNQTIVTHATGVAPKGVPVSP